MFLGKKVPTTEALEPGHPWVILSYYHFKPQRLGTALIFIMFHMNTQVKKGPVYIIKKKRDEIFKMHINDESSLNTALPGTDPNLSQCQSPNIYQNNLFLALLLSFVVDISGRIRYGNRRNTLLW